MVSLFHSKGQLAHTSADKAENEQQQQKKLKESEFDGPAKHSQWLITLRY